MAKMTKAVKKKRDRARKKAAREKQRSILSAAEQSTEPKQPTVTPYPTAGPKVSDFEQKLDEHLEPEDKPKRGRPPGVKHTSHKPEPAQVPNEIIKQAVQVPFDLWAISQKLKGLELDDKEAAMLAEPVKTLLDYYLPQLPTIVFAWASLTIMTYAVMKPRLEMIAEIKKQKKAASSVQAADRGPGDESTAAGAPTPPAGPGRTVGFPAQLKIQKL